MPELAEQLDFAFGGQPAGDEGATTDEGRAVEWAAVGSRFAGFGHDDEGAGNGREDCAHSDQDPDADGEGLGAGEVQFDRPQGAAGQKDGGHDEGYPRAGAVDAGPGFLELEEKQAQGDEEKRYTEPVDGELAQPDEAQAKRDGAGDAGDYQTGVG